MDDLLRKRIPVFSTSIDWRGLGLDPSVITANSSRIKDRFVPSPGTKGAAAIVAFGESLNDTWREIRGFETIFSCSGAHKFLVDRDIVPTYHIESDPQPHKPKMLGTPHPGVTYVMASICHPTYFDLLEAHGAKILLYHLLFTKDDVFKHLPSGEWLMTRGNTVGARAVKLAYLLGYRDQHLFGFDGSGKHAAYHPNGEPAQQYHKMMYGGKEYWTTYNLFYHTAQLFQDLNHSMPELKCTFHGDGLASALGRRFKRTKGEEWPMAVMKA